MTPVAALALNVLYLVVVWLVVHAYHGALTERTGVPRRPSLTRRAVAALIARSGCRRRPNGGRHRRSATTSR